MPERQPFDVGELVARSTSGPCFICEYLRGNLDYHHVEVFRTAHAVAFLNKHPTLFGSVLVVPIEHIEQVTGDMTEPDYLELQRFIYRVSESLRKVLEPERVYVLSLGSQSANSHVHWHIAPLPSGVPLEEQQYHALMHEKGVVPVSHDEQTELAAKLSAEIAKMTDH